MHPRNPAAAAALSRPTQVRQLSILRDAESGSETICYYDEASRAYRGIADNQVVIVYNDDEITELPKAASTTVQRWRAPPRRGVVHPQKASGVPGILAPVVSSAAPPRRGVVHPQKASGVPGILAPVVSSAAPPSAAPKYPEDIKRDGYWHFKLGDYDVGGVALEELSSPRGLALPPSAPAALSCQSSVPTEYRLLKGIGL